MGYNHDNIRCIFCGKFSDERAKNNHIDNVHGILRNKKFSCVAYKSQAVHQKAKPDWVQNYSCVLVSENNPKVKSFIHNSKLKCDICGVVFLNKEEGSNHLDSFIPFGILKMSNQKKNASI